nr:immunoglobulin heavy chain junction region [Mus musculus]
CARGDGSSYWCFDVW